MKLKQALSFVTSCHIHKAQPNPMTCVECQDAIVINLTEHNKNQCIPKSCWYHNHPDWRTTGEPMLSWK